MVIENIELIVKGKVTYIYDQHNNKCLEIISNKELDKTIIVDGENHSFWIAKYFNEILIETRTLYQLAKHIAMEKPNHNINFSCQMLEVEKYQYILDKECKEFPKTERVAREIFDLDKNRLAIYHEELNQDKKALAKIKGIVLFEMTKYNLM